MQLDVSDLIDKCMFLFRGSNAYDLPEVSVEKHNIPAVNATFDYESVDSSQQENQYAEPGTIFLCI